jgi:hypothetical protein
MPVPPNEIEIGKCYVTATGQVRRVIAIENKQVTYDARGKRAIPKDKSWGAGATVALETFASAVEKEVEWFYDPDYPERGPPS